MSNLLDVTVHAVHSCAPEKFPITVEAVEAHGTMPNYYRIRLAGINLVITNEHRKQIIQTLADAPPFITDGPFASQGADAVEASDAI